MYWEQLRHGFQLYDHMAFHHHVGSKTAVDSETIINDRKSLLPRERQPCFSQFMSETFFVSGFKQARSKKPVDPKGCSNNSEGDWIPGAIAGVHVSSGQSELSNSPLSVG